MKKRIIVIAMVCVVMLPCLASAQVVSTFESRNDWAATKNGKGYFYHETEIYSNFGIIGVGFQYDLLKRARYTQAKPYVTMNFKPFSVILGYASNNLGDKQIRLGIRADKKVGRTVFWIDASNYFSVNQNKSDYLDAFMGFTCKLNRVFSAGVTLGYDKWWREKDHQYLFLGPVFSCKVLPKTTIFIRPGKEWEESGGKTETRTKVRVGLNVQF